MSVTNVTRLSLACFVRNPLNIDVFCSPTKRSVKRYVKFGGRFFQRKLTPMFSGLLQKDLCKGKLFQTKLLSRLSHKDCRLLSFPVLLRKFTTSFDRRGTCVPQLWMRRLFQQPIKLHSILYNCILYVVYCIMLNCR